ncbi:MAG: ABC transporter ATP-binding protein [Pseudomonadota bacterium]|nr:ABC transporter ATP-binding protein [Pseudomonadota bacterium]
MLALVGPSGSGKSTVLKTIAGLLSGAEGYVRVNGQAWLDSAAGVRVAAHRRNVGLVFQSYALFPHLTALENVMASVAGSKNRRRRVAIDWLGQVRMKGLEDRKPAQLSGGQQQRVALARALARAPEVLLLDEPFSAVDQMTRERLYEELAELRRQFSAPTVFVTHSIAEAQMLGDRMVVLHRGRTLQAGTPDEVYRRPHEPDVARLMGHKNVFRATVCGHTASGALLDWHGAELRTEQAVPRGPVAFVVPAMDIRIVAADAGTARPNTLAGRVEAITALGGVALVRVSLGNAQRISLSAPTHIVARRGLEIGGPVWVALLPAAIHVMADEDIAADSAQAGMRSDCPG